MTRKDYIRAAEIVRAEAAPLAYEPDHESRDFQAVRVRAIREAFVALFTDDNPRFDRERFLAACEPK